MIVIYNPTAGRRRIRMLWRVLDLLLLAGKRVELVETRWAGHALELARQAAAQGGQTVVAAGGDGTIAEVAGGIAGTGCQLGIIPLGTANVLAHELGLPFQPQAIAAVLGAARTREIWPGLARSADGSPFPRNGVFVQMLGAGFDAQVVHHISLPLKRRLGAGAYALQAGRELGRYGFPTVRVRVDDACYDVASVIVTKGRLYAGRHLLAPEMSPMRPGFTVALFERGGPIATMRYGLALTLGLLPGMAGLRLLPARSVVIEAPSVPVQTDGDAGGAAPLEVRDADRPIPVLVA
jgi:diacylglycerol kinase family enzyme